MVDEPAALSIHNDALTALDVLAGSWDLELSHASFLDDPDATLTGSMTAEWLDGGALLALRTTFGSGPPASLQVIGRNEDRNDYEVLYADDRGVSRIYAMTFGDGEWTQSRADPGFHQRFEGRVLPDGERIDAVWLASHDDGQTWEHDFDLRYTRKR